MNDTQIQGGSRVLGNGTHHLIRCHQTFSLTRCRLYILVDLGAGSHLISRAFEFIHITHIP